MAAPKLESERLRELKYPPPTSRLIPLPIALGHLLRIIPQCTSNSKHEILRQHRWSSGPGYFDLRNIRMPRLSVLDRRCSDQLWSIAAKAPFELLRFCSRQC